MVRSAVWLAGGLGRAAGRDGAVGRRRDAAVGLALIVTAADARAVRPWLITRVAADAGDTLAVSMAVLSGVREPRFLALGALALSAMITGVALDWLVRAHVRGLEAEAAQAVGSMRDVGTPPHGS